MSRRALRITEIPTSINYDEFRKFLETIDSTQDGEQPTSSSDVFSLTLVSEARTQITTVIFRRIPLVFESIFQHPDTVVDVDLEFNGATHRLKVDCNFLGMRQSLSMQHPNDLSFLTDTECFYAASSLLLV
jgi:hypothetical protein